MVHAHRSAARWGCSARGAGPRASRRALSHRSSSSGRMERVLVQAQTVSDSSYRYPQRFPVPGRASLLRHRGRGAPPWSLPISQCGDNQHPQELHGESPPLAPASFRDSARRPLFERRSIGASAYHRRITARYSRTDLRRREPAAPRGARARRDRRVSVGGRSEESGWLTRMLSMSAFSCSAGGRAASVTSRPASGTPSQGGTPRCSG